MENETLPRPFSKQNNHRPTRLTSWPRAFRSSPSSDCIWVSVAFLSDRTLSRCFFSSASSSLASCFALPSCSAPDGDKNKTNIHSTSFSENFPSFPKIKQKFTIRTNFPEIFPNFPENKTKSHDMDKSFRTFPKTKQKVTIRRNFRTFPKTKQKVTIRRNIRTFAKTKQEATIRTNFPEIR